MKINLTNKQTDLICNLLNTNLIESNLKEYKDDKEFYNKLKRDEKIAKQIIDKIYNGYVSEIKKENLKGVIK